MPFKNKEDKKNNLRKWYVNNSEKVRKKTKARRQEIREWFQEYKKGLCCSKCSENHPSCLDFHHRDKQSKDDCVYKMVVDGYSKDRIMAEIEKCDVLCSNCHRKLHFVERGKY